MTSVPAVWQALQAASSFSLSVTRPSESSGPLTQLGEGIISPEIAAPRTLVWRERGSWIGGALSGIGFQNATEWRLAEDGRTIDLSHLRRGDRSPTVLVTLSAEAPGHWRSVRPHLCGLDRYQATLRVTPEGLSLSWLVESPTDPYEWLLMAPSPPTRPRGRLTC